MIDQFGTRSVQEYLLPILDTIDRICRENHIEYSLMGGGLLGAVRHGGFIPWDDDLDIVFSRQEYQRFLKVCEAQLPPEYMIFASIWVKRITRKDNDRIREEEGCVDLFVFDNVPDHPLKRNVKHLLLKVLQGMIKEHPRYTGMSVFHRCAVAATHIVGLLFPREVKLKLYSLVSQWGNDKESRYVNNYVTYYSMISTQRYEKRATLEFMDSYFEGRKVRIFKDYDSILTTQFGNYHVLPPENERRPKHLKNVQCIFSPHGDDIKLF